MLPPSLPSAVFLVIKIFVLIGILIYSIFAAILVRQEQLMEDVLEESFEPILKILSLLHLAAAIGLFILAFIIL